MCISSARAVRAFALASLATLSALGCLADRTGAPRQLVALAIRGRIISPLPAALGDPIIRIHVFYTRSDGESVPLSSAPQEINVLRGTTTVQPVTVDVGACLRDPARAPAGGVGCFLGISLALVGDNGLVADSATSILDGPVAPGNTAQTPQILLAVPDSVRLITQGIRGSAKGPPLVLSAIVYDANGSLPNRHPLQWSSSAPEIATATSLGGDSAQVAFVAVGNAIVRVVTGSVSDSVAVSVFATDTITTRPMRVVAKRGAR